MKITNENADSEYIYTPYEVKAGSWSDASVWENSDETLRSFRLYGSRSYEYHVNTGLTSYFPELAAETFLSIQDKKNTEYEQAESYYNAFVYEHYHVFSKNLVIPYKDVPEYMPRYDLYQWFQKNVYNKK